MAALEISISVETLLELRTMLNEYRSILPLCKGRETVDETLFKTQAAKNAIDKINNIFEIMHKIQEFEANFKIIDRM